MHSRVLLVQLLCTITAAAPAPATDRRSIAPFKSSLVHRQSNTTLTFDTGDTQVLATGTTQNGLDGACAAMTVIFARGTTELGELSLIEQNP